MADSEPHSKNPSLANTGSKHKNGLAILGVGEMAEVVGRGKGQAGRGKRRL